MNTILEPVDFVLEATSAEFQLLWEKHNSKYSWNDSNVRQMITIGMIDSRPICLQYGYCKINNKNILVWELTSTLADYKMAEKWLDENINAYNDGKHCDANNFHNIFNS